MQEPRVNYAEWNKEYSKIRSEFIEKYATFQAKVNPKVNFLYKSCGNLIGFEYELTAEEMRKISVVLIWRRPVIG
jgi:hypothetical protein